MSWYEVRFVFIFGLLISLTVLAGFLDNYFKNSMSEHDYCLIKYSDTSMRYLPVKCLKYFTNEK